MNLKVALIALSSLLTSLVSAQLSGPVVKESPYVPPRRWAMVVGAHDYKTLGKLRYATDDAKSFAKTLIERFRFTQDTLEVINDSPESAKKPDAETIRAALRAQLADKRLSKGDLFIFYFSGHGIGTPSGDYIMPTDGTSQAPEKDGLPIKDIVKSFVDAGLKNVLFIADACRSGTNNTFGQELQDLAEKANIAILLGSKPGQRSYEYPQLGGGAFTSFLLRALRDKQLRDARSGALWASDIAASVQTKVAEYTSRDYPANPQTPTAWTEKTQDILLGAFPQTAKDTAAISNNLAHLDSDKYSLAVSEIAADCYQTGKFQEAIDLYKAAEGVGRLDDTNLLQFALTLNEMGRRKECGRAFARLAQEGESDYLKNLAIMLSPNRAILARQRVVAAQNLWSLSRDFQTASLVWTVLRQKGSFEDRTKFLESAINLTTLPSWARTAFLAEQMAFNSQWKQAIPLFAESLSQCDASQKPLLLSMVALSLVTSRDPNAITIFGAEDSSPQLSKTCLVLEACMRYRASDYVGSIKPLKKLLALGAEPDQLLYAIRFAGPSLPEIADQVAQQAKGYPYAWQAILANGFVALLCRADGGTFQNAILEAVKYTEDELSLSAAIGQILFDVHVKQHLEGKSDDAAFERFASITYLSLMEFVDQFVEDSEIWQLAIMCGFVSGRQLQLVDTIERYLGNQIKSNQIDAGLRPFVALVYMAIGRDDEAKRIDNPVLIEPLEQADWSVLRHLYWQLRGKPLPGPIPSAMDGITRDMRHVLRAVELLDRSRRTPPAVADLQKIEDDHQAGKLALALSWDLAQKPEIAEGLMKEVFESTLAGMPFVQETASQWLYKRYRSTGRWQLANQILYAQEILQLANPMHRALPFLENGQPAKYSGRWEGDVAMRVDKIVENTSVIQVNGKAVIEFQGNQMTGSITFTDGTRATFSASIDPQGNTLGTYTVGDAQARVRGKFLPPQLIGSIEEMEHLGPTLFCLDKDFRRIVLLFQNLKKK